MRALLSGLHCGTVHVCMQVIDRRCAVGINILKLVGRLVGHYIVECAEPGNVSHVYLMIAPCMYSPL